MKNKRIDVRVSSDDHDMILSRSVETGLSVSSYLRQLGTTGGHAVSSSLLQKLIYEARAIGNNINQLARSANTEGMSDDLFNQSLAEIRDFVSFLRRVQGSK